MDKKKFVLFKEYNKIEEEVRNKIKKGIYKEKDLNESFNYNKINNPSECLFYMADVGNEFISQKQDSNKTKEELYFDFFKFFNNYLKKNIGKNFNQFMVERIEIWKKRNYKKENLDIEKIDNKILLGYLFQKFVKNTFNGIERERKIKEIFISMSKYNRIKLDIQETGGFEDNKKSVDFYIKNDKIKIGIQVKPISFFYGLKNTTNMAAIKFQKSILQNKEKIPVFIVELESGNQIKFLIRDKQNKNKITKINLQEFFKIFQGNFKKEVIYNISKESANAMVGLKKQNITSKIYKNNKYI